MGSMAQLGLYSMCTLVAKIKVFSSRLMPCSAT